MQSRYLLLIVAAALLALPAQAPAKRKLVQPKAGQEYSGRASNGGVVTLTIKRTYFPDREKIILAPYITWTRVGASCDIFNGTAFVPTPKRITARFQVTAYEGRVTKGRFDENLSYAGQPESRFKGTFTRRDVQGTIQKFTTRGVDNALGFGCRWGPLTFDLARQDA